VLGEFLVSSVLAIILFNSGASHSFVSSSFVKKNNIPTVLLKTPLLTRTPRGDIKCQLGCSRVRIILSGVEFLADLVVIKSKVIDVILGMDWLSLHNGLISCADKVVHLTNPEGVQVTCHTQGSGLDPMVFSMEAKSLEEVPVVNEYLDVFPEQLPGIPPDRDIEFFIDLVPGTSPIVLGMDWLSLHNGLISCADKVVHLTNPEGVQVTCHTRGSGPDPMIFSMEAKFLEEVPVVNEYLDVFPEELPGIPPDRDIEFFIDLIPGTSPIGWQPLNWQN
jgi:hypothetical protein